MKNKVKNSKAKKHKLTKLEEALIYVANMMEDPMHSDYRILDDVLNILRLKKVSKNK